MRHSRKQGWPTRVRTSNAFCSASAPATFLDNAAQQVVLQSRNISEVALAAVGRYRGSERRQDQYLSSGHFAHARVSDGSAEVLVRNCRPLDSVYGIRGNDR